MNCLGTPLFTVLLCVFFLIPSTPSMSKVYLVSVGISDYPGTSNDLTLPAIDAKTITRLYSRNSGITYCQLLDQKATVKNITIAIERTFAKALSNDIVVLFFSGHGYPGGFCAYDDGISYKQIKAAMVKSKCRNKMIFADACFSGKMRSSKNITNTTTAAAAKNLKVMLFLSSRDNEKSYESPDMQNGYFTTYLVSALRGHADMNHNRIITAKELYNHVHQGVVKLSENKQHPVMYGKFPDNMSVMKW